MLDRGRVFKIEKNLAWVEFASSSACAQCGACAAAASGKMVFEAENTIGAKAGDLVEVEISTATKVMLPIITFGLPILLLFIGVAIGSLVSEAIGIILGIIFLVLAFLVLRLIDRFASKASKLRGRIVRKI